LYWSAIECVHCKKDIEKEDVVLKK